MYFQISKLKSNFLFFIYIFLFIFLFRYIPHPPNFTPIIALTVYISIFLGIKSSVFLILAFAISDMFIGLHNLLFFTWGSLALISIICQLSSSFMSRIFLLISTPVIFFIISNFGVWLLSDIYSKDFNGIISCYILAIPFFSNTLISTLIFGLFFELFIIAKSKIKYLNH